MEHLIYNFRIYPKDKQKKDFERYFSACRFVYNWALDLKNTNYKRFKEEHKRLKDAGVKHSLFLSSFDISRILTLLKKDPPYAWLNNAPSLSLIKSLDNLDKAFQNFYRNIKQVKEANAKKQGKFRKKRKDGMPPGYPKFKSRYDRQSFAFHQGYEINQDKGYMTIPKAKKEKLLVVFHRKFTGLPKTCTITKTKSDKYYVSIVVETATEQKQVVEDYDKLVGADHGVINAISFSNGDRLHTELDFTRLEKRKLRYQRDLSRKQRHQIKGTKRSKNYEKNRIKLARVEEEIANKRTYTIEILADNIAKYLKENNYSGIVLRKYDVKSMTEKIKPKEGEGGAFEHNGRDRQKKLNKSILNSSLGYVRQYLSYKLPKEGLLYFEFSASETKTTAKCYTCKSEAVEIDLITRLMHCSNCGEIEDIDYNAAKNTLDHFLNRLVKEVV